MGQAVNPVVNRRLSATESFLLATENFMFYAKCMTKPPMHLLLQGDIKKVFAYLGWIILPQVPDIIISCLLGRKHKDLV